MSELIKAMLCRPSERTRMEATLTGLSVIFITSFITPIYIIFFTEMSTLLKVLSGLGSIGIILFIFSNLSLTYIQLHAYKKAMGLYSPSQKLLMKLEEAKQMKIELDRLIKETEQVDSTKSKNGGLK